MARVSVKIVAQDIASFIFGNSLRIFHPVRGEWMGKKELKSIKEQIRRLDSNHQLFGVKLLPVDRVGEFQAGRKFLRLICENGDLNKDIVQITKVEHQAGNTVISTKCIWPQMHKGSEGFFGAEEYFEDEHADFSYGHEMLMLHFIGKLPQERETRKKTFHEIINTFMLDFMEMVRCWSIAIDPEIIAPDGRYTKNPYGYFVTNFGEKHGSRFNHELVYERLNYVYEGAGMYRIKDIYDQTPFIIDKKDLISPLLHQMQIDILEAIHENPSLFDIIFPLGDEYVRNRLRILLEMYFGPKDLKFKGSPQAANDPRYHNGTKSRKLSLIKQMIIRGATEGERQAARAAYLRVAGVAYSG